jgi:RecJ-like exonuclease
MSERQVTRRALCSECAGKGRYLYEGEYNSYMTDCSTCKKQGSKSVAFVMSDDQCPETTCFDGTESGTRTVETTNWLGQRVLKHSDYKRPCSACFGTGKKHFLVERHSCGQCGGKGTEKYWDKSFFGNTETQRTRTCTRCKGKKHYEERSSYPYTGRGIGSEFFA